MIGSCVFDNGKSQTGAAGSLGVALVHPVEPLKDPILMLCGNTDAGIADNQALVFCLNRYAATRNVVLDGIIAEVVNNLLEHSADTFDRKPIASNIDLNALLRSAGCQNFLYILCDNAIKYNVPGGSVTIHAENNRLVVNDTGIGIPAEHKDRIFERFYRVDKSHSKASGGTGLGLSIVKHAAAYHKAEITLESTPGKGTAITIQF